MRGNDSRALIGEFGEAINAAAQASGVDPNLISAIIYEEQTHLTPFEAPAEKYLGLGDTVGLGQVTVGLNGFSRAQLLDPATNIQAIATHLSSFSAQPTATQATKYNCGSCAQTSSYGRRVDYFRTQFYLQSQSQSQSP